MISFEKAALLAILRSERFAVFLQFISSTSKTKEEYNQAKDFVCETAKNLESNYGNIIHPEIFTIINTPEGSDLLRELDSFQENLAQELINYINIKHREQYLRKLKNKSHKEYLAALPEITEDEIYEALVEGLIVNCLDITGNNLPIRSDENYNGAFMDTPIATAKISAETLASAIIKACNGGAEIEVNSKGLRLHQVMVVGTLDLNWLECPFPLGFEGCSFTSWIWLDYLKVPWISFEYCDFTCHGGYSDGKAGAINATGMQVENDFRLLDNQGLGQLFLPDSSIGIFSPRDQDETATDFEINYGNSSAHDSDMRVVFEEATFKKLYLSLESRNYFKLGNNAGHYHIEAIELTNEDDQKPKLTAEKTVNWLFSEDDGKTYKVNRSVAKEFEDALYRSGDQDISKEFGIRIAELISKSEGAKGLLKRIFLGYTVRYFYENTRALWFILALWAIAWAVMLTISLVAPETLTASPLANEYEYQERWVQSILDAAGWSLLYSMDLVFSPLSLGQTESFWSSVPIINIIFAIIKGISLLLMGLFLTGVTHITDKNSK
ncbi:hypothetical protein ACFP6B_02060 [Rothia nasimurium]|uniref:hypothetical protein n=1 Tax=Rothia nasimurium TaxID=85336 RepID=UPI003614D765